jgi:hypothetical protein
MLEEIAAAPDAEERAGLLVDLADMLEREGDVDRALRCLEAAHEESPDRPGLATACRAASSAPRVSPSWPIT